MLAKSSFRYLQKVAQYERADHYIISTDIFFLDFVVKRADFFVTQKHRFFTLMEHNALTREYGSALQTFIKSTLK